MRIDLREGGEFQVTLTFAAPKKRDSDYGGYYYIYGCKCQNEQSSFIADEELHNSIQSQGAGRGTSFKLWSEKKQNPDTGKEKNFLYAKKVDSGQQQGQYNGGGGSYSSGGGGGGGGGDRTMAIELQCMTKCASWLVAAMISGRGSDGGNPDEIAQATRDLSEKLYVDYRDLLRQLAVVKDAEQPLNEPPPSAPPNGQQCDQDQRGKPAMDSSEEDADMFGDNADVFSDLEDVPF